MKFLLDSDNSLIYRITNEENKIDKILLDENVLIYDYFQSDDITTHLVYLKKEGELNYVTFKNGNLNKSVIGKFDTSTNSFNQLSILIVKSKLNIFYSYSNIINSNIYTLHHVVLTNNIDDKYTIIRYISKKSDLSFSVDNDTSGNIHLFYNTISNNYSYIYYTYFNPFNRKWLTNPVKLSNSEKYCELPAIYVDLSDNIHGFWWEKHSKDFILRYKRMSSVGKEKFKWIDIKIPSIVQNIENLNIIEKENIISLKLNNLSLVSNDFGINWVLEERKLVLDKPREVAQPNTNNITNKTEEIQPVSVSKDNERIVENNLLEQIILNQREIKLLLNNINEEQLLLKSKVSNLEESIKTSKSGFRRFFS